MRRWSQSDSPGSSCQEPENAKSAQRQTVVSAEDSIESNKLLRQQLALLTKMNDALQAQVSNAEPDKGHEHDFDHTQNTIIGKKFIDYEKDMAPRPVAKPPNVELDCKILGIYEIKEQEQTFKIAFEVTFQWIDPSIPASEGGVYPEGEQPDFSHHFKPCIEVLDVLDSTYKLMLDPPQLIDRFSGRVSMKGHFSGIIIQVYNMREFPFDIQYLCITFKMAPVKEWDGQGGWKIKSRSVGEFQHPKMTVPSHSVYRKDLTILVFACSH
jgi:hypothetical protein